MRRQPRHRGKKASQKKAGKASQKVAINRLMSVGGASQELATWLTKEEAAERLQTSVRSIERRIAAGEIEAKKRRKSGPKQSYETVVNPHDIDKLLPAAHVVAATGATAPASSPRSDFNAPTTNFYDFFQALLATMATAATTVGHPSPPEKPWLTLEEASDRCGLSVALLKELCRSGQLQAIRDGRQWKIHRRVLDAFEGEKSQP